MDPVTTTLVSAFVAGAAKSAAKIGDEAVTAAYAGLKDLVTSGYQHATELLRSIAGLEAKPDSSGRRDTLAEELKSAHADDDPKLVDAAEAVLKAAEKSPDAQTIGVDWREVRAALVKIGEIRVRAGAIGFRAARSELGAVVIPRIDASGSGK